MTLPPALHGSEKSERRSAHVQRREVRDRSVFSRLDAPD
jgi:hypothetical protein